MSLSPELLLVMPVYNEQASVRKVVLEWFDELQNWTEDFVFLAINDGSSDRTPELLIRLREQLGDRFEILSRENRGHGQSCLEGYSIACERNIPYVFQIDSDGQCDPQYFFRFWRDREKYSVIYGKRVHRDDGWRRVLASTVLRCSLFAFAHVNCVDANVPYRLMQTKTICKFLTKIPPDFSLANIALAVLLKKEKNLLHGSVPIHFRERYGGEPSVPISRFGKKAFELFKQLEALDKRT
jgi:glycosyltransferase involved in cell wall biosynthesis